MNDEIIYQDTDPTQFWQSLHADIETAGGELRPTELFVDAVGATMFDLPNSEDGSLTVLLPKEHLHLAPSQSLLRISSGDGRRYLGIVTHGPFAEPDGLRGDSHMLVTVAARGGIFLPPYHGRAQVTLLGEERPDGSLVPPLLRPLPNSAVHVLDEVEAARILGTAGHIRLGLAVNYGALEVRVDAERKDVLPRHTAILGTTGSGKSTTVARLVQQAQEAGMAVILLDVEGEYTHLHEPSDHFAMRTALADRGLVARGIPPEHMAVYHLVGRETANPDHPNLHQFSLRFDRLSPYAVAEILEMSDAQADRFHQAYEVARAVLRALNIFPTRGNAHQEREAAESDEFETGYPCMDLGFIIDIVRACLAHAEGTKWEPRSPRLQEEEARRTVSESLNRITLQKSPISWRTLLGKLSRLLRLRVFDRSDARPLDYRALLTPGTVSILDLSDTGMSELSNIVIADLLRGVQDAQETVYTRYEGSLRAPTSAAPRPTRTLIIIEEAHEFLSQERVEKVPVLFQQVARIAKRGRKRWLGLVFVTQLPQHLPRQVLGLVNSYILHKITDPGVIRDLQRTVSGIDASLWHRLPGLAPGQAIVSFPHMTLPLLVSMDPAPARLRLVE